MTDKVTAKVAAINVAVAGVRKQIGDTVEITRTHYESNRGRYQLVEKPTQGKSK